MKPALPGFPNQSGIVLVICLIFLTVLTLLGISGVDTSRIHLTINGNTQLREISFHNAESALAIGESAWNATLTSCLEDRSGCSTDIEPDILPVSASIDWDNAYVATSGEPSVSYGRYVVEYLGWRPIPGEDQRRLRVYRITARGQDRTEEVQTVVQSLFGKCIEFDDTSCPQSDRNMAYTGAVDIEQE